MLKLLRRLLFIGTALFLQVTVLELGSSWGCRPDFLLIVLTWLALSSSATKAVGYGFFLGLLQDTFSGGPIGLYALVKMTVGLSDGALRKKFIFDNPANRLTVVIVNTFIQALLIVAVASILSLPLSMDDVLDRELLYRMFYNGILSFPIMWVMDKAS